jgi:hypothetical protein
MMMIIYIAHRSGLNKKNQNSYMQSYATFFHQLKSMYFWREYKYRQLNRMQKYTPSISNYKSFHFF